MCIFYQLKCVSLIDRQTSTSRRSMLTSMSALLLATWAAIAVPKDPPPRTTTWSERKKYVPNVVSPRPEKIADTECSRKGNLKNNLLSSFQDIWLSPGSPRPRPADQLLPCDSHRTPTILPPFFTGETSRARFGDETRGGTILAGHGIQVSGCARAEELQRRDRRGPGVELHRANERELPLGRRREPSLPSGGEEGPVQPWFCHHCRRGGRHSRSSPAAKKMTRRETSRFPRSSSSSLSHEKRGGPSDVDRLSEDQMLNRTVMHWTPSDQDKAFSVYWTGPTRQARLRRELYGYIYNYSFHTDTHHLKYLIGGYTIT